MARKRLHVTPKAGEWQVKRGGATRASAKASTQKQAIQKARQFARGRQPSQVYIHGRDGKVRDERTYGSDPFPPRG